MQVKDIMTTQPASCRAETGLGDVARLMRDNDCGAIPVLDGNGLYAVGVVTDRDIVCRALSIGRNPLDMSAGQVMSTNVVTVSPDKTLQDCVGIMEAEQVRRLLVVDMSGRCLGIVSQADMARSAPPNATAELVRRISDSRPAHAEAVN